MKKNLKKIFFIIFFSLFLIEFFSFIASKLNLLVINSDPDYIKSYGNKWRTEKDLWGSWHKTNFLDRHTSECFDVEYQSNNIGARDFEDYDSNNKDFSIVLLGDSFAEGFGVSIEKILPKLIEKKINKKVLNFGSAGHFGPLQSKIIYTELASKFKHDEIIYLFYPHNDFTDNDWDFWKKKIRKFRNRPYFLKNNTDNKFEIYYPGNNDNNFTLFFKDFIFLKVQPFLLKYTYTANTLRSLNYIYSLRLSDAKNNGIKNSNMDSSYFFNNPNAIDGAFYSIEDIFKSIKNIRKSSIVIIPTLNDLKMIKNGNNYKNLKWYLDLNTIAKDNQTLLIDLADYTNFDEYKNFIFECDQHWNEKGHKFVYNIILDKLYSK